MNVCVAHLQMNACVAKNFGAWTEKVGHPCPTFMAHPTRVGRRVGALHKKLGHPWLNMTTLGPDHFGHNIRMVIKTEAAITAPESTL